MLKDFNGDGGVDPCKNHGVELTPLNICWIEGERAIFTRTKLRRGRGGAADMSLNIVGSKSIEKNALPQQIIVEIKINLDHLLNVRHLKRCGSSEERWGCNDGGKRVGDESSSD